MEGENDQNGQGTRYGRKAPYKKDDRDDREGKKRPKRHLEEKFRKYEAQAAGFEFVPALMFTLERVVEGVSEDQQTDLERRLSHALDEMPESRDLLKRAVDLHRKIPDEVKRRAFSLRMEARPKDKGISDDEMSAIIDRANVIKNLPVATLATSAVAKKVKKPTEGCCCPGDEPPRDPPPTPPPPNQYEVTFVKLYCVDESDPEWFGSDEPYVVFAVLTEEMAEAGTAAQGFHTPVYGDVDDGDTRPDSGDENLRVFGFTGPRAIASSVLISASCFENDLGNPEDTTNAVRTALTTVATAAAGAGGVVGWVVAGVAVVGIGVTYLVDLIGADDTINGTLLTSLTEAQADSFTAAGPYMFPALHFDGGDGDGIYDVYMRLRRA
jgi:hypothetical protein